jgi:hypothetical protein
VGKAVSWQIDQPPTFVHREDVNSLVKPGVGDAAILRSPASMFSSEDLPTFERPMKANWQRLVRIRIRIRRAAIKNGG